MYPIMVIHIWVPDTIGLTYLRNIRRPMPVWNVVQFPIMAAAVISVVPLNPAGMAKRLTALSLPEPSTPIQPQLPIPCRPPTSWMQHRPPIQPPAIIPPQQLPHRPWLPHPRHPASTPASLPWPPALLPATRKSPVPKAVTTIPSRLTKSALQRVTTDTPAIPVAAIKLVPTMATILPFLPEKPVLPFTPAPA